MILIHKLNDQTAIGQIKQVIKTKTNNNNIIYSIYFYNILYDVFQRKLTSDCQSSNIQNNQTLHAIQYKLLITKMCITFFYLNHNRNMKVNNKQLLFFIAFNRDQDVNRQTLPFGSFEDDKNIYAGKDIVSGGSWLGINRKTGIVVILTNYRLMRPRLAKSRGLLVKYFLQTNYTTQLQPEYTPQQLSNKIYKDMQQILQKHLEYSAFNISVYNIRDNKIFYMCSQIKIKQPITLQAGKIHGYSNSDIGSNWWKVKHGKKLFEKIILQNWGEIQEKKEKKEEWKRQKIQQCEKSQKQEQIENIEQVKIEKIQKKQQNQVTQQSQSLTHTNLFQKFQKIMKNTQGTNWFWKYFQSSIFIKPYYNYLVRKQLMTKSTFYAVFTYDQKQNKIFANFKEVSYNKVGEESVVEMDIDLL